MSLPDSQNLESTFTSKRLWRTGRRLWKQWRTQTSLLTDRHADPMAGTLAEANLRHTVTLQRQREFVNFELTNSDCASESLVWRHALKTALLIKKRVLTKTLRVQVQKSASPRIASKSPTIPKQENGSKQQLLRMMFSADWSLWWQTNIPGSESNTNQLQYRSVMMPRHRTAWAAVQWRQGKMVPVCFPQSSSVLASCVEQGGGGVCGIVGLRTATAASVTIPLRFLAETDELINFHGQSQTEGKHSRANWFLPLQTVTRHSRPSQANSATDCE